MPLVAYGDSSSSDEASRSPKDRKRKLADKQTSSKRRRTPQSDLPPPPSSFQNLYATSVRVSTQDDPALHNGRKRAVPHEEGVWPTHVYLEWLPSAVERESLEQLVRLGASRKTVKEKGEAPKVHSSLTNDLGTPLPLHISLSCPLALRTEQRQQFLDNVKSALNEVSKQHRNLTALTVGFRCLRWVANAAKTRWFLVLEAQTESGIGLALVLDACNEAAAKQRLPQLYACQEHLALGTQCDRACRERRAASPDLKTCQTHIESKSQSNPFHISIAWTLAQESKDFEEVIVPADAWSPVGSLRVKFDEIKLKMGNTVMPVPIYQQAQEREHKGHLV